MPEWRISLSASQSLREDAQRCFMLAEMLAADEKGHAALMQFGQVLEERAAQMEAALKPPTAG
jgi:hypothetical protein